MKAADSAPPPQDQPKTYRQQQAEATRDTITRAALSLFSERGYARTTVEAIAKHARVSPQTVYAVFGSKVQILLEIRRVWFRESDLTPLVQKALQENDAHRRLEIAAHWMRCQLEVGGTVSKIIEEATRADAKVAEMWDALRLVADDTISTVINGIADQLANDVTVESAVDIVWALSRGEVFRELTERRGWLPDRYESWLAATLAQQLLGADVRPAAREIDKTTT